MDVSTRIMRPDLIITSVPRRRFFPVSGNVLRARLRTAQCAEALIRSLAHHGFKTQPYRRCIGRRATGKFRLLQEYLVDVEGLLHTYYFAIDVWLQRWTQSAVDGVPIEIPVKHKTLNS